MDEKYFDKKDLDSRLDFFQKIHPPQVRKKLNWAVAGSLFVTFAAIFFISQKTVQLTHKNIHLESQKQKLQSLITQIEKTTKKIPSRKNLNEYLKKTLLKSEIYKVEQSQISAIIQDLARLLPKDSWLESISVQKKIKQKSGEKTRKMILAGFSSNEKNIENYINSIKQCKEIRSCNLEKTPDSSNKPKEIEENDSFKFKITCELNPISNKIDLNSSRRT